MLSLGIQYTPRTWKAVLWDEDRAADLHAFPHAGAVWEFLTDLLAAHPATPAVLPSGFGIPVTRARDLLDRDILEMRLGPDADGEDELGPFLAEARRRLPRAFCIPAVKLLPSVPPHRKRNRLDLGTADALCAAAWALHSLERTGRPAAAATFLLAHLGAGGRDLLAIVEGRVVDGVGRTAPGMGTPSPTIYQALLAARGVTLERHRARRGWAAADCDAPAAPPPAAFWEGVEKECHALCAYHALGELIVTGDRRREAIEALTSRLPCATLPSGADGYEGALGAAVIAAGLTGGPAASVVDRLGVREARDRVLD